MKPASVLRAISLIKTGEVIELGHVLNASMPIYGPRRFDLFTKRTSTNTGVNQRGGNEVVERHVGNGDPSAWRGVGAVARLTGLVGFDGRDFERRAVR